MAEVTTFPEPPDPTDRAVPAWKAKAEQSIGSMFVFGSLAGGSLVAVAYGYVYARRE